ncbi:MAG: amidohydrolase family protein [Acidobacteria bacterium]|nr:amidohydrolase family protein [Acidobacteriota bacterium]
MVTRKCAVVVSVSFLALLAGSPPAWSHELPLEVERYADLVLYNGQVLTVDRDTPDFTVVKAVAIRDGKILAVGENDRILKLAGPKAKRMDLAGKTVIPGVVDTHSHPNRYALAHYQQEFVPAYLKFLVENRIRTGRVRWERGKAEALAELKKLADGAAPGDWIVASSGGHPVVIHQTKRADLDQVTPNNPAYIRIGTETWGMVNTKMLEILTKSYGEDLPGIIKGSDGAPTGLLLGVAGTVMGQDILPETPPELLVPVFKKELEEWAAIGVTTLSGRFRGNEITAWTRLDQKGELPIRIGYTHEIGRWNPYFKRDIQRLGTLEGHGTERFWMIGLTVGITDGHVPGGGGSAGGDVCSDVERKEIFPDDSFPEKGLCFWDQPGDPTRDTILIANRNGYRIAGVHTFGDKGQEIMLDAFAQANKERSIMGRRFAVDHAMMVSPKVIEKASKLGIIWSLQVPMFYGRRTSIVSRVFGEDIAHRWSLPVKSMLDAGVRLTFGADTHEDPDRQPMHNMEVMVTRVTHDGRVWGPREKIDRNTALRIMTRWGAEYVLREKELGSIEVGKLADLVILDKNPLDPRVPDEALSDIKVVQTLIGGQVAYDAATAKPFPPSPRQVE